MLKKSFWVYIRIAIAVLPIISCGVSSELEEPQPTYTPLPTYTPYPTYTPDVTPTLEGPVVLYENDFSDPDNTLEITELERFKTYQENGAYYVEHLSSGPSYIAVPVTAHNFVLDVDVSVLRGPDDGATFGLGFRGREGYGGDYYRWRISTNGNFHIHANTNGKTMPLEWFERGYDVAGDWFKSSAINKGYGVTNHLRIVANSEEITFFINNQMVMQARDSRLQNNYFALVTHADGYSETTFDNLKITELDDKILEENPFPTTTPAPTSALDHILFEDNFDNGDLDGWTITSGSWDVVDGQLMCISSHDARIFAGDDSWEDYSISADIMPISGSVDVGIYGYLLDTTHTYQGQLWNEKARIKIWDDDWSDLAAETFLSTNDTWYNLRLEFRDTKIKLYINDALAAIVEDTVYQNGKIGLRCASNSQAYFDNVIVTRLSDGAVETEERKTPESPPEFTASYVGTQTCAEWPNYAVFIVENTTLWVLQSAHQEIYDNTNSNVVYSGTNNRPFLKEGECPPGNTILPPYNTRYIAANIQEPESGTNFAAAITLCTEDDLGGECAIQIVDFVFEVE